MFPSEFLSRDWQFNFRVVTQTQKGRFEEIFSGAGSRLYLFSSLFLLRNAWIVGTGLFFSRRAWPTKYSDYRTGNTALSSDNIFQRASCRLGSLYRTCDSINFAFYSGLLRSSCRIVCVSSSPTVCFLSQYSLYRWTLARFFLDACLTGSASYRVRFSSKGPTTRRVDAMTTDDTCYAGKVADYFLRADGELSGLLLKDIKRFRSNRWRKIEKLGSSPRLRLLERKSLGRTLLAAEKIANLNIRYNAPQKELRQDLERWLESLNLGESVTISLESSDNSGSSQTSKTRTASHRARMIRLFLRGTKPRIEGNQWWRRSAAAKSIPSSTRHFSSSEFRLQVVDMNSTKREQCARPAPHHLAEWPCGASAIRLSAGPTGQSQLPLQLKLMFPEDASVKEPQERQEDKKPRAKTRRTQKRRRKNQPSRPSRKSWQRWRNYWGCS